MEKYDYLKAITNDVLEYIQSNPDCYDQTASEFDKKDRLYDLLSQTDCVTGSASGSYTCNAWVAEEYLCHNVDLIMDAIRDFELFEYSYDGYSAELLDVYIRLNLLPTAIDNALRQLEDNSKNTQ